MNCLKGNEEDKTKTITKSTAVAQSLFFKRKIQ